MYLAYFDESESADKNVMVVAGVVASEADIRKAEQIFAYLREFVVSKAHVDQFREFHTSDLFNCRDAFEGLDRAKTFSVLAQQGHYLGRSLFDVFYSVVHVDKHKEAVRRNATALTIGFRMTLLMIEEALIRDYPEELVVAVFDDPGSGRGQIKKELQQAYRDLRKKLSTVLGGTRGALEHFHDDLYFGDSAFSVGLQMADFCAFFAKRHEEHKQDTEPIFQSFVHLIKGQRESQN